MCPTTNLKLEGLTRLFSPDNFDFGRTPKSPMDQIEGMIRDALRRATDSVDKSVD